MNKIHQAAMISSLKRSGEDRIRVDELNGWGENKPESKTRELGSIQTLMALPPPPPPIPPVPTVWLYSHLAGSSPSLDSSSFTHSFSPPTRIISSPASAEDDSHPGRAGDDKCASPKCLQSIVISGCCSFLRGAHQSFFTACQNGWDEVGRG